MSAYGNKLNPYRKIREPRGVKGIRQSVSITNNPSTIDQNQQLLVRFPNLSNNDVIVPGTTRLAFEIELTSTDDNATIYQNIGRTIVKKTTIRISGNEIMSIDDSAIYHCYVDLWKSTSERLNMAYQGIGETNMLKHRVGADDKASDTGDEAIATAYGARFCIPLDFELLETHMPFLSSRYICKLYNQKHLFKNFDMVTDAELARQIRQQVNARSMKGIPNVVRRSLKEQVPKLIIILTHNKSRNDNRGVPNQLYSQGMKAYQQWDEINKFFALNSKKIKQQKKFLKDLNLSIQPQLIMLCATKELTKKKDMLSELAFSGRHAEQSVWVISQRYNSVLKDLREQTKWLCMFYTKDRDSFDNCLRENDVIPTLEERQRIKEELKKKKHRKLILKTDQPTDYWLLN
ncbi:unnamed protein product [Mytilus edulis]|uniref:Uncharacterized protein n=1 Tax=Mytilus edulis TaxID=6550 RepID=A0A8S3RSX9_MYTED|nr:unnamed protein product [Mytilus edulis]